MSKNKHQGKFHLLTIFFIPAILVSTFLADSWIVPAIIALIATVVSYILLRK